jgi:regulator of replication initiation timing
MDATKISTDVMASNAYNQTLPTQMPSVSQDKDASGQVAVVNKPKADSVNVSSTVALKNLDTVRVIEQMHASLNQLAKGVRETNESLNRAVVLVDSMKDNIQTVVENNPILQVDSKERNDRLMEYSALRKELISLMVPPPPPPVYEKVKHMWESLFEVQNGSVKHSAAPELANINSDAQLKEASITLDKTSTQLADFSSKVTQALIQP